MLDEFEQEQKIVYKVLKNSIKNNKCSHAYLFETNGYKEKEKLILSFAKSLLCPYNYTNNEKCKNCCQCENIDKNIYSEIKIINPDGMWIKKEQLLSLQEEFKTKSLQSSKKVYIINNADRLNVSAANSILKFLEEPSEGIIAILVADNIHQLLDTIISRCQIITLSTNKNLENKNIHNFISIKYEEKILKEMINNTLDFINYLEEKKLETLLYTKELFLNKFTDKDMINTFFEIMILFYKDCLNIKMNRELELFEESELINICKLNKIEQLNEKIKIIINAKNSLKINVNTNLLIDKLIIDVGGELHE